MTKIIEVIEWMGGMGLLGGLNENEVWATLKRIREKIENQKSVETIKEEILNELFPG